MDDTLDGDGSDERYTVQNDWRNISERRIKEGYREGITCAQEAVLQDGFEKGFKEHLSSSLSHGYMSGVLSGLLAMQEIHGLPNIPESDLTTMMDILGRLQEMKTKRHEVTTSHQNSTTETPASTSTSPGASVSKESMLDNLTGNVETLTEDQTEPTIGERTGHHEGGDGSRISVRTVDDEGDVIQREFTELLEKLTLAALIKYEPAVS